MVVLLVRHSWSVGFSARSRLSVPTSPTLTMAPSVSTLVMVATVCLAFTASAALALEDRDPAVVAACEARCATLQEDDGFFAGACPWSFAASLPSP